MADKIERLIWVDLEMTGLDPDRDRIIEMATIVTDAFLNEVAVGPVLAIHQPDEVLDAMDEWNREHHGSSGLIGRVRASDISIATAEEQTIDFLSRWVDAGTSPMCGNSICQDRRFLYRYMPRLEAFFHYRNLDVSTLKILAGMWMPSVRESFVKQGAHLALDDIRESIGEMRHYRDQLLRPDLELVLDASDGSSQG